MPENKKIASSAATLEAEVAVNANNNINDSVTQNKEQVNSQSCAAIPWVELEDFVFQLKKSIKCAECVMHEIGYDYFNQEEENRIKNNHFHIIYGYDEYTTKANIVVDYLYTLRKLAEKADAFVNGEGGAA